MSELKEAVLMDGHEWIRADVVARMESLLIAELELLRKIAQATWARRDEAARRPPRGPGATQYIPDEIDDWLGAWFFLREGNAQAFQTLAADTRPFDPELELLNRLGRIFPEDVARIVTEGRVLMSEAYGDHPDTIGSTRVSKDLRVQDFGQSALGFLNQSRRVRGLPRIVAVFNRENGVTSIRFEPWAGPGNACAGRVG